jgi:hypothetical protein
MVEFLIRASRIAGNRSGSGFTFFDFDYFEIPWIKRFIVLLAFAPKRVIDQGFTLFGGDLLHLRGAVGRGQVAERRDEFSFGDGHDDLTGSLCAWR